MWKKILLAIVFCTILFSNFSISESLAEEPKFLIDSILEKDEYKIYRFYSGENYGYKIPYQIIDGKLTKIERGCINDHSITLSIDSSDEGRLIIDIPRTFFDVKLDNEDDDVFFILINGEESDYEEIVSEESRLATIDFSKATEIVFAGTITGMRNYCDKPDPNSVYVFLLSPKHQFKNGILPDETICNENLELVFKSTDGSPACVKPTSVSKLIEREWASS